MEQLTGDEFNERQKVLIKNACIKTPELPFCESTRQEQRAVSDSDVTQKLETINTWNDQKHSTAKNDESTSDSLKRHCHRVKNIAKKLCTENSNSVGVETLAKCAAYLRDCAQFVTHTNNALPASGSFDGSQVNANLWQVGVNGLPYYPVNRDRAVAVGQSLGVPYGSWGGGYNSELGVRDYWSQHQQAGGDWQKGLYGYKSGWSVPLVQSLGVEGQGGSLVNVPLHGPDFGKIGVDNGYGVGGYYSGNEHVGVDWKKGDVNQQLGVGVPFAGVGFNYGRAVSFPSIDSFIG